jgi:hypothetical protein
MRRLIPQFRIAPNTAVPTELPTMCMNMIDEVAMLRSFHAAEPRVLGTGIGIERGRRAG